MTTRQRPNWFKRKRYGYGWVPVTWQGWTVVGSYIVLLFAGSLLLQDAPKDALSWQLLIYFVGLAVITILLLLITRATGPTAKWRWGSRDDDNPTDDY